MPQPFSYYGGKQRNGQYSNQDMKNLCDKLDNIQGSFILSCYENDFIKTSWQIFEHDSMVSTKGMGNIGNKEISNRTEKIYRKYSIKTRPEIIKLYQSGAYNCFSRHPWEDK